MRWTRKLAERGEKLILDTFAIAPSFGRPINTDNFNGFQRNRINFRLVRGDGEIVEEIVSKEQQKEINKVIEIELSNLSTNSYPD